VPPFLSKKRRGVLVYSCCGRAFYALYMYDVYNQKKSSTQYSTSTISGVPASQLI